MLVTLLTVWLLGGGTGSSITVGYVDRLSNFAETRITDETQRAAVLASAKALEKAGKAEASASARAAASIIRTAKRRDAKPEEFEAAFSQIRSNSVALQQKLVQERLRLKATLTREQWTELHATQGNSATW